MGWSLPSDLSASLQSVLASTPNRGSMHVFLGDPMSDGGDKTTVEPGNSYSPGVFTCGVSVWIHVDGRWYCPDLLDPAKLAWGFEEPSGSAADRASRADSFAPVLVAAWNAGSVSVVHRLVHEGSSKPGEFGTDYSTLDMRVADRSDDVVLCVVVRGVGPAGGVIASITARPGVEGAVFLDVDRNVYLVPDSPPDDIFVGAGDPTPVGPWGALAYHLLPGANSVAFSTPHVFGTHSYGAVGIDRLAGTNRRRDGRSTAAEAIERARSGWSRAVTTSVFAPDPRITTVWNHAAFHILSAMERGLPRIGAVNYPVFWIRDGVIVLRALDMIGRSDLARIGADYLAPLYHSGGFGAESDGPGEGIWALVRHALITRDAGWLESVFSHIEARVAIIGSMISATEPLYAITENRIPGRVNNPWTNLLCLPSEGGVIRGRMDWHAPDFYINCWAYSGLSLAAVAARTIGRDELGGRWERDAADLQRAIGATLLPGYGNERDPAVAPYPSGAFSDAPETLVTRFADWYRSHRFSEDGGRVAERLWTYFEAAQAHNALLLGQNDEAWVSIDGLLAPHAPWDVSAFVEGPPNGNERLPFRNDTGSVGWLRSDTAVAGNMPHNWTSAEMINLIRDLFVVEQRDGLLIGAGIPRRWFVPGATFGIKDAATDLGPCSYTVTVDADGRATVRYSGPSARTAAFPCTWEDT